MGGVAGHLMHLYDNRELSFNELAKILASASKGDLIGTEKTDGFNIYLGFKDGEARAARNKGDMRRGGMNAAALAARKYKGGESIRKVYMDSFRAFEKAMMSLSEEERAGLFGPDGEIFYNSEVLGPGAPNVVKYDPSMITIHPAGHKRYNHETNEVEVIDATKNAQVLDDATDRFAEALAGEEFDIARTAVAELRRLDDDRDLKIALERIQKGGWSGDRTINDLLIDILSEVVNEKFSVLSDEKREGIVARVLALGGHPSITDLKKGLPRELGDAISQFVQKDSIIPIRQAMAPIEEAIHDFSVELLRGLESAYILDNPAEVQRLKAEVADAIQKIKAYTGPGSEMAHEMLYRQLMKLKHHGNIDTAVEGFVFQHDGNLYKFTGNFAPVNQLLGLFRYGRGSVPAISSSEGDVELASESIETEPTRKIAVVPGKFKPPHAQHLEMVEYYAEEVGPDGLVLVLISPMAKETPDSKITITREDSKRIWELYIDDAGLPNAVVLDTPFESPVKTAYELPKGNVPDFIPQSGDLIIPGASNKIDPRGGLPDWHRFSRFQEMPDVLPGVLLGNAEEYMYPAAEDALHASNFRSALETPGAPLDRWLPYGINEDDIVNLIAGMKEVGNNEMTKPKEPITLENLFNMVEEVIDEEENIEEISAMGGAAGAVGDGAIQGYSLPLGAKPRKRAKKKRRKGRRIYIPD
tara:strand:- start:3250 stop:5346 length:2097 start_codon:yes stop_codon:yes gene_type:complete